MKKKETVKEETTTPPEQGVKIPPIEFGNVIVTLIGASPLLVHRFREKSIRQIKDKQEMRAKAAKEVRDPEQEFKDSLYPMPGKEGKYGIPAGGVKKCAVSACRFIDGVPMTIAKGSFHILAGAGNLIEIKGSEPVLDESIVRIGKFGNKVADLRYRARFDKWEISFPVRYNKRVISAEQLLNLFENAGFSVGLCEWRPEKDGSFGMFEVKKGEAAKVKVA